MPTSLLRLVDDWRNHLEEDEEIRGMKFLEVFHLDHYRAGNVLPAKRICIDHQRDPGEDATSGTIEDS